MAQATTMKPIGSPTASGRTYVPVFDEDWLLEVVDGPVKPVESAGTDGTSLSKILFDEHKNVWVSLDRKMIHRTARTGSNQQ